MSDRPTPRADAALIRYGNHILDLRPHGTVVTADFARTLERENAELREALEPLANLPIEQFLQHQRHPESPIIALNGVAITASHVIAARTVIAATKGDA